MLSITVTLVVIFAAIVGALFGLWRGFIKSAIRLATVILSAIATLFLAVPLTETFVTKKNIYTLIAELGMGEKYNELIKISPAAEDLICALLVSIIATIVFIILFFIIKGLMFIPYKILSRLNVIFKKEKFTTKLIGLPIGALQGLISVMVIVLVLAGFFNVADNAVDTILSDNSGSISDLQESLQQVDSIMDDIKKDPVVGLLSYQKNDSNSLSANQNTIYNVSLSVNHTPRAKNNFVFETLTKIRFRGKKLSLTSESDVIARTFVQTLSLVDGADSGFSKEQIDSIDGLVDLFGQSDILTEVGAEIISGACGQWSEGKEFLGIAFEGISEDVDPIILALFGSMKYTTADTLKEDMQSFVDVLSTFNDYNLLDSFNADSIMKNLSGDFIEELLTILSNNERFNVVIPEVTNLSIRMIAKTLNITDISSLLLEPGHYELSEEDIKNLGDGFDHIFRFIESLETLEGDGISFDKLDAVDISAMGQALDAFKNTSLLENAVDPIAGAVVSGVTGSSSEDITDALVNGNVSYESLMDTVQSTANVINNMKKEDATVEEKQQAIVELFENITPENADVIVAAVDEEFVVQMGVDPQYADSYADALSASLKEMANLSEDEHEAEAEKVKYIFDMFSNSDRNAYGEDGVFESVEDIITVAMDSKVAGAVLIELAYDENGNEVCDALGIAGGISVEDKQYIFTEVENYYNEKKETESPEEAERISQMAEAIYLLILGMK